MPDGSIPRLEDYRPLIERALARTNGAWTWKALAEEVDNRRAFLLPSRSGCSVAVLQPMHDLHVFTASGDLRELLVMEAETAERARASGYDRMTMIGRRQWECVLRPRGWKQEYSLVKGL